ncbi:zf-HC2 domain-containing protein [Neisseria sp. 23W00296]|uniref:zf-HC2 domain-containing protein n=1 Tax=unclassified Neisseria TaxID=2623750 RepID=UPI0003453479|nr:MULTISPECIES: zf-HC2 domain-containing protein [unclassified Neisseria]
MLKCRQACRLLSEAQDRRLTRRERLALAYHLFICVHCRRYRKQLAFLRNNLKRWQNRD